ncbi:MAG: DNA methyltransferase [Acidimicrobiales bacterium]
MAKRSTSIPATVRAKPVEADGAVLKTRSDRVTTEPTIENQPYQLLPPLSDDEYRALKADIAVHGVLVAVEVDDQGHIIDGHHRVQAWQELRAEGNRVPNYPRVVRLFTSEADKLAHALVLNLARRHLTRAQRRELVVRLREQGWSLRRIATVVGINEKTARNDLNEIADNSAISLPDRVERKGGGSYPARRRKTGPSIFVLSDRDARRAAEALRDIDDGPSRTIGLARAEKRARKANLVRMRSVAAKGPSKHSGDQWELRTGDFREVLADLADQSVDAIVTDPPYGHSHVSLYEDLAAFSLRVLKPGRLAVVYAGQLYLDKAVAMLARGGLTYTWLGINVLNGQRAKVPARKASNGYRCVLIYSAGIYEPRGWLNDVAIAEGRGRPTERPLHPWQQALEPVRHWVRQVSQPGELVVDPMLGSGTTVVAAMLEGRRFLGCDIDPGGVETTRRRLVKLVEDDEGKGA